MGLASVSCDHGAAVNLSLSMWYFNNEAYLKKIVVHFHDLKL